jgi:hypothetical protein
LPLILLCFPCLLFTVSLSSSALSLLLLSFFSAKASHTTIFQSSKAIIKQVPALQTRYLHLKRSHQSTRDQFKPQSSLFRSPQSTSSRSHQVLLFSRQHSKDKDLVLSKFFSLHHLPSTMTSHVEMYFLYGEAYDETAPVTRAEAWLRQVAYADLTTGAALFFALVTLLGVMALFGRISLPGSRPSRRGSSHRSLPWLPQPVRSLCSWLAFARLRSSTPSCRIGPSSRLSTVASSDSSPPLSAGGFPPINP